MSLGENIFEDALKELDEKKQVEDLNKSISLDYLLSMQFPENKWLIDKLIPSECITLLSGAPASFKTWLLLRMALDIAKGEYLLDQFKCEQNNVLIIDEENHLRLIQERLKALGATSDLPIYFLSQKGFLVSKKGMIENVLKLCEEKNINVIFIDSLVRINNADENDASKMSEVFREIKRFCQNHKTVILTHHERKEGTVKASAQNRLRGSSDIQAAVDCHLAVIRDRNDRNKIIIEQAKLRLDEEMKPFEANVRKNENLTEFIYLGQHSEEAKKKDLAKEAVVDILEEETNGLSMNEIVRRVKEFRDIGNKSITSAIKELITEKIVLERKGEGNTKICYLWKFSQETDLPELLV